MKIVRRVILKGWWVKIIWWNHGSEEVKSDSRIYLKKGTKRKSH